MKLKELYPFLDLGDYRSQTIRSRGLSLDSSENSSRVDAEGGRHVRWGDAETKSLGMGITVQVPSTMSSQSLPI